MKFTIGLPITKTKYLKDSLDSIAAQTNSDYELIIRNNAKTAELKAEVKEICKEWLEKPHVNYQESDEQLTISENFNKIVASAKGKYFTILSDDDLLHPDFLKKFDELISKYPTTDVFHCRVKRILEDGSLYNFSENAPEWETQMDLIYHRITGKRSIILSDFVVKTDALKANGGFPSETSGWGIDEITWCRLAENGVAFTQEVLLIYRRFQGNHSFNPQTLKNRFNDIEFIDREIKKMIIKGSAKKDALYPREYLMNLHIKRIQKQKDMVLEHFAYNHNYFKVVSFYLSNKKEISFQGVVKAFGAKIKKTQ
ncbi:glycosyltransferase family 2 protein [Pararhodonellum marinum]|uniref:glycosyltransferase family 2 protein n=1 Tax=Pararhodonellum marinum TaxID=2755358 RepID=UPI0018904B67|nr:glycosyltransferase family 2 protein [Pararhodonellum marinum]